MANKMRDAAKERFWREVLKRFAASGLSVRAFCRREGLAESMFYAWRQTLGKRDAEAKRPVHGLPAAAKQAIVKAAKQAAPRQPQRPAQPPVFLPLLVRDNGQPQGVITLELAGGRLLRLPEAIPAARLTEIIVALEAGDRQ